MAFQNHSSQEMMSEINVTPLVDVMLVLLVVFIVTAPLLSQSLIVKLPKTATVAGQTELQQATLSISAQGKLSFLNIDLDDATLAKRLADEVSGREMYALRIQADEAVPYGRVAQVMAIAQHAGVSKLSFQTIAGH